MKTPRLLLLSFVALLGVVFFCACTPGGDLPSGETHSCPVTVLPATEPTEAPTEPATPAVTEAPTEPPVTNPEDVTMAPTETIPVIVNGKTDYTLSLPADEAVLTAITPAIEAMNRIMDQQFGTHPAAAEATDGRVIRVESDPDAAMLDWSVKVEGETIVLRGGCAEGILCAIRHFVTQYLAAPAGDLYVAADGNYTYTYATDKRDNTALLSYEGGDKTVLAPSDDKDKLLTPTWLDSAIMVELRIDTASIGGTFAESYDLIDFYAATGVNVIWLSPVYARGGSNGYGNIGLHAIEPALTGTEDQEAGWQELKKFVDYAHSKGVYIFLDIISWGTVYNSPIYAEHPDWYYGEAWGGGAFNWANPDMKEWFISTAVENIEKTGADGYRCDCEPFTAGYRVFAEIRKRLNDKGIYPIIMSEEGGRRDNVFDCEQDGVLKYKEMSRGQLYQSPVNFFVDGYLKIVQSTKLGLGLGGPDQQNSRLTMGSYRYYTNCITNHDYQRRNVNGNRLKIGYAAIYAPYIPLWYMGDEFGVTMPFGAVLYDIAVDYSTAESDPVRAFFHEDVKQMIAIRRTYPELFAEWPIDHRDSNICEVKAEGLSKLQNYARYGEDKMIIILANNEPENDGVCTVEIPFADAGMDTAADPYASYRVTDLLTGRVVASGYADTVNHFTAIVPYEYCGVYMVEKIS